MKTWNPRMTYGEAHYIVKANIDLVNGDWVSVDLPNHKPRMSRDEAAEYYSNKIHNYFSGAGYAPQKKYTGIKIEASLEEKINKLAKKERAKTNRLLNKLVKEFILLIHP